MSSVCRHIAAVVYRVVGRAVESDGRWWYSESNARDIGGGFVVQVPVETSQAVCPGTGAGNQPLRSL